MIQYESAVNTDSRGIPCKVETYLWGDGNLTVELFSGDGVGQNSPTLVLPIERAEWLRGALDEAIANARGGEGR